MEIILFNWMNIMIRILDIIISFLGLALAFPVLLLILVLGFFDTGSPLFIQKRVGKNKKPFLLVKFRTMHVSTKSVASHLASKSSITKLGDRLRKTKLDELPQLWNVLKGDMSLVGPRPNLYNQIELIKERDRLKVYDVKPGVTGLAQIKGIDMSVPCKLAEVDQNMIRNFSIFLYFKYIIKTILGNGSGDKILKD